MNKFKLNLPENGFAFPCNMCFNNKDDARKCKDCMGYEGFNESKEFDIKHDIELILIKAMEQTE